MERAVAGLAATPGDVAEHGERSSGLADAVAVQDDKDGRRLRCPLCVGSAGQYSVPAELRLHLASAVHGLSGLAEQQSVLDLLGRAVATAAAEADAGGGGGVGGVGGEGGAVADHPSIAAVKAGDVAGLRAAVCGGAASAGEGQEAASARFDPITFVDSNGSTALHWAAGCGALECVRFLVEECGVPADQVPAAGRSRPATLSAASQLPLSTSLLAGPGQQLQAQAGPHRPAAAALGGSERAGGGLQMAHRGEWAGRP